MISVYANVSFVTFIVYAIGMIFWYMDINFDTNWSYTRDGTPDRAAAWLKVFKWGLVGIALWPLALPAVLVYLLMVRPVRRMMEVRDCV